MTPTRGAGVSEKCLFGGLQKQDVFAAAYRDYEQRERSERCARRIHGGPRKDIFRSRPRPTKRASHNSKRSPSAPHQKLANRPAHYRPRAPRAIPTLTAEPTYASPYPPNHAPYPASESSLHDSSPAATAPQTQNSARSIYP